MSVGDAPDVCVMSPLSPRLLFWFNSVDQEALPSHLLLRQPVSSSWVHVLRTDSHNFDVNMLAHAVTGSAGAHNSLSLSLFSSVPLAAVIATRRHRPR